MQSVFFNFNSLYLVLKATSAIKLFFAIKESLMNKENVFFVLEIFRFFVFVKSTDFEICDAIRNCLIMEVTLMHIPFES